MGYLGNWISGHSGTAQKNKKAFSQKRSWVTDRPSLDRPKERKVVGRYKLHHGRADFSDWMIGLFFVFMVGASCWWFQGIFSSSSSERPLVETTQEGFTEQQRHAYSFLVESGYKNLTLKDYRLAAYEFDQALKIAPYGKQARLGLLETLEDMCAEDPYHCDRAEEQREFVEGMGWQESD